VSPTIGKERGPSATARDGEGPEGLSWAQEDLERQMACATDGVMEKVQMGW
jgi:hypothetical protein